MANINLVVSGYLFSRFQIWVWVRAQLNIENISYVISTRTRKCYAFVIICRILISRINQECMHA